MPEKNLTAFLQAYTIRQVEQALLDLFSTGQINGTIHTCIGQEFTGIVVNHHLKDKDIIISNHRCHGHYISRFNEYRSLIAEILGKPSGLCQGFGGSQHLHRQGFYSSGIQGGMLPAAAGMALAKKKISNEIVVVFLGDGTLGQGVVYEVFNIASLFSLPILFVLENNQYSQSTNQKETLAGTIEGRGQAFHLQYFRCTTFEIATLFNVTQEAVQYVRSGHGPAILQIDTYRLAPHSKGDDSRDTQEIQNHAERDPLNIFLRENANDPEIQEELHKIQSQINKVIHQILEEPNAILLNQKNSKEHVKTPFLLHRAAPAPSNTTQVKEINRALHESFRKHPDLMLLGEDLIDPYGGTFKVSKGLSSAYPARVLNMPISEASIVGMSAGRAAEGKRTIAEIMFGDFLAIAFDQILNHATKFRQMFGHEILVPVLIRTPMGARRGYGATHSQSLEKFFLGIPDLNLFVLHPRVHLFKFYTRLLDQLDRTTLVIENKTLYSRVADLKLLPDYEAYETEEMYPTTFLRPKNTPDITIVGFGGIGLEIEKAVENLIREEIYPEIIYPLHISKLDVSSILDSLTRTGKVVFIEEGTDVMNLSSEYVKRLVLSEDFKKTWQIRTLSSQNRPVPSAMYLENQMIPGVQEITQTLLSLYDS